MTYDKPTIVDFLLARIAEDEAVANNPDASTMRIRERLRRECEAKRRIIAERDDDTDPPWVVLCHLAAVYADHVHYREEEWSPATANPSSRRRR